MEYEIEENDRLPLKERTKYTNFYDLLSIN